MTAEHKAVVHESYGLRGTKCYGCKSVEVLVRRRRGRYAEVYWCDVARGYIDRDRVRCPLEGD